jgi:uncharacterized protein (TIGR03067 family)
MDMIVRCVALAAFLLSLGFVASATGGDAKKEHAALQGEWQAEKVVAGGMDLPAEITKMLRILIDGDKIYDIEDGKKKGSVSTFTLDASKSPKHIDTVDVEGPDKGKKTAGLYEIKGDMLTIVASEGADRPTELKAAAGTKNIMLVFRKVKK